MAMFINTMNRGIGAAIAIKLAQRGANIVVNYTSEGSKPRGEEVIKLIESHGSTAALCKASVAEVDQCPRLIEAALKLSKNGKIDILVHK